jgi:hypothetical protein
MTWSAHTAETLLVLWAVVVVCGASLWVAGATLWIVIPLLVAGIANVLLDWLTMRFLHRRRREQELI